MPTLLLLTTSSHAEANGNCDVAIVTITPALAQRILERLALFQTLHTQDGSLHQLRYWDNTVDYACMHKALEEEVWRWTGQDVWDALNQEIVEMAGNFTIGQEYLQRVDCAQMVVTHDGAYWIAIPKHGDIHIRTASLPLLRLQQWAQQ